MTRQDATVDGIKQAFEDFMAHEAERAIAEATQEQDSDRELWVVFYGDGRFGTERVLGGSVSTPSRVRGTHENFSHIAFPIEPLNGDERNRASIEDSSFDRPIERLWASFRQAMRNQLEH